MDVQDLLAATRSPELAASASSGGGGIVGTVDFFRVLTAQMSSQDPLEPLDQNQFMAQLAQFSQLEQTASTNQQLAAIALLQENLAAIQQMTQGSSLIGQTIEYTDAAGATNQGVVQALRIQDGIVVADLGGDFVPLPAIQAVLGSVPSGT